MKLLICTLNYAPEPTGVGKYSGEMAMWLADHGHEVEVICGLPHYPKWQLYADYVDGRKRIEPNKRILIKRAPHYVPSANNLTARARIRLETSFTLSSARYWLPNFFLRSRPNAVIAVMPPMQIGIWPLLYRFVRRVPWVLHVQDLQVDAALRLNMLKGRYLARTLYRVERFLLGRATAVSTISEPMRQRIIAKGRQNKNTWLVPNWADITSVQPGPSQNAFRKSFSFDSDSIIILYAGSMGEKQGLDLILEVANEFQEDQQKQFVLVGDGSARAKLQVKAEALALKNLRFLPIQPVECLNEMLAAADIHLVIQKRDAADLVMPSKLTNILAAGRPSIATTERGTALYEAVQDHETGIAIPPDDKDALASAIRYLADNPEDRVRFGKNARAYAEKYLDRDKILSAFEKQLSELCQTGSA